jgi:hypothetical protein
VPAVTRLVTSAAAAACGGRGRRTRFGLTGHPGAGQAEHDHDHHGEGFQRDDGDPAELAMAHGQ